MTIRSGGGPRDNRSQARPAAPGAYDEPGWARPRRGRRFDRNEGGGTGTFLKFLVFTLVLAALVLVGLLTFLRPLVAGAVFDWAYDNPGALRIPFVEEIVRERLGDSLSEPASADPAEVEFAVVRGDTPRALAPRLRSAGVIKDERAFIFQATIEELTPKLREGNFRLARNMTPPEVVDGLVNNEIVITIVPVTFREGLRIEQITAKIQTLTSPLTLDAREFYDLATEPPASLVGEYRWIEASGWQPGMSLEGFLAPATYDLMPEHTAEDLLRMMLDQFERSVGEARMTVPESRGMSFHAVLTLASIVEREARLDEERALIAGVYQNRLSSSGAGQILNADPTVFYAWDTMQLAARPFEEWQAYLFWDVPDAGGLSGLEVDPELQQYQSYQVRGLPPGPICTPSLASIEAALAPDIADGYRFFLAIPDGGGAHVFATTQEEHDANRRKYGYL